MAGTESESAFAVHATSSVSSEDPKGDDGANPRPAKRARRALRACTACRKGKIRCDQGAEDSKCSRCAHFCLPCEFEKEPPNESIVERSRLDRLENSLEQVLTLLARQHQGPAPEQGLFQSSSGTAEPRSQRDQQPFMSPPGASLVGMALGSSSNGMLPVSVAPDTLTISGMSQFNDLTSQTSGFVTSNERSGSSTSAAPPSLASTSLFQGSFLTGISPTAPLAGVSPSGESAGRHTEASASSRGQGPAAAHRSLGSATAHSRVAAWRDPASHEAPFKPLVYNPEVFANQSRMPSPVDGNDEVPEERSLVYDILACRTARALFSSFMANIHLYMPILEESISYARTRDRHPFLFLAMLSIAGRYCVGRSMAVPDELGMGSVDVQLSQDEFDTLRAATMTHLSSALLTKVHSLEDVQAICFLSAWGITPKGEAPDSWLLSGFAYRLARRLGLHLSGSHSQVGIEKCSEREVSRWKTYLCLYSFDRFLTVGFGRPPTDGYDAATLQFESLKLLALGESIPSLSTTTAASVACRVDLANVARDYVTFVSATLKQYPAAAMSEIDRLNTALDTFAKTWTWSRSPAFARLGAASKPIRILYDHLRVCLNTIPLKLEDSPSLPSGQWTPDFLHKCIKKSKEASTSIIQAHQDALRDDDDSVLSYSFDYHAIALAHAALVILRLGTSQIAGLQGVGSATSGGVSPSTARHYLDIAVEALIQSDRSAHQFSTDLGNHLQLIVDTVLNGPAAPTEEAQNLEDALESLTWPSYLAFDASSYFSGGIGSFDLSDVAYNIGQTANYI